MYNFNTQLHHQTDNSATFTLLLVTLKLYSCLVNTIFTGFFFKEVKEI